MKTNYLLPFVVILYFLAPAVFAAEPTLPTLPANSPESDFQPRLLGPHQRSWQRVNAVTNKTRVLYRTNSITQLETGLAYINPATRQWEESNPNFVITNGYAVASQCQHQVIVSPNLNAPDGVVVDLQTPDGKRIRNGVIGLNLFDPITGTNMQVSTVRDVIGTVTAPNEITWVDAFDGLRADVRVRNFRGEFHQDILLRERVSPEQLAGLGFNPETVRLETWTAFVEVPPASVTAVAVRKQSTAQKSAGVAQTEIVDQTVNFGATRLSEGLGYVEADPGKAIRIPKQWLQIENTNYLVETARYADLLPLIAPLPIKTASLAPKAGKVQLASGRGPPRRGATAKQSIMEIARMDERAPRDRSPRAVLDYVLMNSQSNYTFAADTTYYISGTVNLTGTTVYEGNAVLKFTNDPAAKIAMSGNFLFLNSPYRTVFFTSKDDNTTGDPLPGSTGAPTNSNGGTYLSGGSGTYQNLRFAYAGVGIQGYINTVSPTGGVWHCQFVRCGTAINSENADMDLHNVLLWNCGTGVQNGYSGNTLRVENLTADQVGTLSAGSSGNAANLTNCILTSVTNLGTNVTAYSTVQASSGAGIYSTNGGGGLHYLIDGSTNRNSGDTNLSVTLLADLTNRTTWPPNIRTQGIFSTMDTTLSPRVERNIGIPDLGWEYAPLDYLLGWQWITNPVTITVTPGTAVGFAAIGPGNYGLGLGPGTKLVCEGTADRMIQFAAYTEVQESTPPSWGKTQNGFIARIGGTPAAFNNRFTDWSTPAQDCQFLYRAIDVTQNFQDSQFHGGQVFSTVSTMSATNCLFERVLVDVEPMDATVPVWRNNLFYRGDVYLYPASSFAVLSDNLFDGNLVDTGGLTNYVGGYNAFVTNHDRVLPTSATDLVLIDTDYVTGPKGRFYYPGSGGNLSSLIDAGSLSDAGLAGLYHFTTIADANSREGNSPLDVGFHFIGVNADGKAIDEDNDGIPSYVEDANGNGVLDSGETDWNSSSDYGLNIQITHPKSDTLIP